jgi:hypothetical protein
VLWWWCAEKAEKEAKDKAEAEKKRREALPEFHKLVRQMSQNFAGKLLSFVSFAELQNCLLAIINGCAASATPLSAEDSATVEYAINLWVSIVLFQPEQLLPPLYKAVSAGALAAPASAPASAAADSKGAVAAGDVIRTPLFCPVSPRVRKQFASAIYQICSNATPKSMDAKQW